MMLRKVPSLCPILNKTRTCRQIFAKTPNVKLHENLFSEIGAAEFGQTGNGDDEANTRLKRRYAFGQRHQMIYIDIYLKYR